MRVELLHIIDCPNTTIAATRARSALNGLGLADVPVELVPIRTTSEAASTVFAGSPTFVVDGVDLFPGTPTSSLACRIYPTSDGLSGAPTEAELEAALRLQLR